MPDDKTYCGQLKVRGTKYGEAYDVLLFADDITAIRDRWNELLDAGDDKPVRLTFLGKRAPKNDWTHYGVVDKWEPDSARQPTEGTAAPAAEPPAAVAPATVDEDAIPF